MSRLFALACFALGLALAFALFAWLRMAVAAVVCAAALLLEIAATLSNRSSRR